MSGILKTLAVLTGLGIAGGATYAVATSGPDATVTRIVDGDTIEANVDGEIKKIRLLNIDTPEMGKECLAQEAKDYLIGRLPIGTEIDLEYDVDTVDKYGRDLAAIFTDGAFVNEDIVRAGFATAIAIGANTKYYDQIKAAENTQRDAKNGIFGVPAECFLPDEAARTEVQQANQAANQLNALDKSDPKKLGEAKSKLGVVLAAIATLKAAESNLTDFQKAAYPGKLAEEIDKLEKKASTAQNDIKRTERLERERIEKERKEKEEREKREKEEAERAEREAREVAERAAREAQEAANSYQPPAQNQAPAPVPAPAAPAVDTYTGCRAYGGNYAMTNIDNKGRAYAKIDCATKVQIG